MLRQKRLQEQQMLNNDAVDKRICDLERMVALQDQTIRCLLDINSKQLAMKGAPKSRQDPAAPSDVSTFPSPRVQSPHPIISADSQQQMAPSAQLFG